MLAAHGCRQRPEPNALVRDYARRLAAENIFAEVGCAFHLGTPGFAEALARVNADQITVLPFMSSEGFFTRVVLPRELAAGTDASRASDGIVDRNVNPSMRTGDLSPARAQSGRLEEDRDIARAQARGSEDAHERYVGCVSERYSPADATRGVEPHHKKHVRSYRVTIPLGVHPAMPSVVVRRVRYLLRRFHLSPARTTLAVVGHGTPRHPHSRDATVHLVSRLARKRLCAEVIPAFLDDSPPVESVLLRARCANVVVVPFLMTPGLHARRDIPSALGIKPAEGAPPPYVLDRAGGRIVCDDALGATDEMFTLLRRWARRLVDAPARAARTPSVPGRFSYSCCEPRASVRAIPRYAVRPERGQRTSASPEDPLAGSSLDASSSERTLPLSSRAAGFC
ncbi:MAG: hypothetical protein D6788_00945, partial [Planctomycetota bacterium]